MGSAFQAEPPEWFSEQDRREMVTFSLADPDWVIHRAHPERPAEHPHPASDCGRFKTPPNVAVAVCARSSRLAKFAIGFGLPEISEKRLDASSFCTRPASPCLSGCR